MRDGRRRGDQAFDRVGSTQATVTEDPAQHLARHLRRVAPPASALHHDDRHGDARRLGRRDADEPLVAALRIGAREAARLARDLHRPEQRPSIAGPKGPPGRPARGGVDQHVPQLAGELGASAPGAAEPPRARELASRGIDDAVDPTRLDHFSERQRARELSGVQRRDAAAREAAAELAHSEAVASGSSTIPAACPGAGSCVQPKRAIGSQQRLDADRVHRELGQALVVRGRERLLRATRLCPRAADRCEKA